MARSLREVQCSHKHPVAVLHSSGACWDSRLSYLDITAGPQDRGVKSYCASSAAGQSPALAPKRSHLQIACDDASDVLLEACYSRAKSKISSSLELVSGSRLATQETENDILGMVFHDKIKPQYTTEIRLTRSGLDYDAQWAHVVPKPGCILLTMRGSQRRSCWSLPGQDERVWIVFNVR